MGSLPPSKPPPARHRPGARSARWDDVPPFVSQTNLAKERPTMSFPSWLQNLAIRPRTGPGHRPGILPAEADEAPVPPGPEPLEERCLLSGDVVLDWNATLINTIETQRTPLLPASRSMAMVHVAMYDAVVALKPNTPSTRSPGWPTHHHRPRTRSPRSPRPGRPTSSWTASTPPRRRRSTRNSSPSSPATPATAGPSAIASAGDRPSPMPS